jgi:hypothetical protein
MKRMHLVLVFASGCATTALAGWITGELRAQTPADNNVNVIHVCAAAGGALRLTPLHTPCPAGQQSMFFKKAGVLPPPMPASSSAPASDPRMVSLERRVAVLEGQARRTGLALRVTAPLEVVDRNGRRVLYVGEDRVMSLYNTAGKDVIHLSATETGGSLFATNAAGTISAAMGASDVEAGVKVMEAGTIRAELGRDSMFGNFRLQFVSAARHILAALGDDTRGDGIAFIADKDGKLRAAMQTNATHLGQVSVFNSDGKDISTLTEGENGGKLEISASNGTPMVEAGVLPGGYGVVKTGPGSFMMAAGVGLPGSFIMGKPK